MKATITVDVKNIEDLGHVLEQAATALANGYDEGTYGTTNGEYTISRIDDNAEECLNCGGRAFINKDCTHSNAVLSDEEEPATYHCPDCGENFIGN